jgi:hypothetical protein
MGRPGESAVVVETRKGSQVSIDGMDALTRTTVAVGLGSACCCMYSVLCMFTLFVCGGTQTAWKASEDGW